MAYGTQTSLSALRPAAKPTHPPGHTRHWLGRLISSPTWENLPLLQREKWLDLYLEKL